MPTNLYVNVQATNIANALVRAPLELTPVSFPGLVIGDDREYNLYFVNGSGFAPWSGDSGYTPFLAIGDCGYPTGGTFILSLSGSDSAAIPYNASPAAVQTALEGVAGIGSGNVLVTGTAGKFYQIEFIGTLAGTGVAELVVKIDALDGLAEVSTLQDGGAGLNEKQLVALSSKPIAYADSWAPITNGWTGELSTNTLAALQAFVSANSNQITKTFQVTLANPSGDRTTFVKTGVSIACSIISPEAFAGDEKPNLVTQSQLAAAVLGANNFTQEELTNTSGNTDVTRPSTSRHHFASVAVTGAAVTRTLSVLTTNSPVAGDVVLLSIDPDTTPGNIIEVRNATSGGTLLETITTDASGLPVFVVVEYSGSAWRLVFSENALLSKARNLAGIADPRLARGNLKTVFSRVSAESADFAVSGSDDGTLFRVSAAGGDVVATLPDASTSGVGFMVAVQKADGSSNTVTTSPATVDLFAEGASVIVVSDGSGWVVAMGYNPAAAGNGLAVESNSAGNTTLTPSSRQNAAVITFTGSAGTRILVVETDNLIEGDLLDVRLNLPATASVVVEIRQGTTGGTLLYSITTDGSGDDAFFRMVFDGTNLLKLSNIYPVL